MQLFVQPAGAGVAVVAARALGHELADLGDEGEVCVDLLGGVELLLQFVWRKPQAGVSSGLVVGHEPVVDEAGDADATPGIVFLPAGEFQLDHDGAGRPTFRA